MEDALQKLNNTLSRKRVEYIEIADKCNMNGEIKYKFNSKMEFDPNYDYKVSLISGEMTSFFPNLNETNNKFYYSTKPRKIEEITLENGAYDVDTYYKKLKSKINN